jgi:tetratricopeptide (TPR) repeat protein
MPSNNIPDPKNENLYRRLGLEDNVSSEKIRKVFFKVVKIFPPEKDRENYILIREAFDILKNSLSRSEYDTKNKFGFELEKLEEALIGHEKSENLDGQIRSMKKILNLAPKLGFYRNKLGLAFMEKKQFKSAFREFNKAYLTDEKNPVYILNMGQAQQSKDNFLEAEILFQEAWNLDLEDYSPPRALASLYFYKLGKKRKAYNTLEKAIEADGLLDFQDFFCIFDKITYYSFENNKAGLRREMTRVKEIAINDNEKDFAGYMLSTHGVELNTHKMFDISIEYLKTAHQLVPDNEEIKTEFTRTKKNSAILKGFQKLLKKKSIHEFVKYAISNMMSYYYGEINGSDWDEKRQEMIDMQIRMMDRDPDNKHIKRSIRRIRDQYPEVFDTQNKIFTSILNYPNATQFGGNCPHLSCSEIVLVPINKIGDYTCPHCDKGLNYSNGKFSEVSSVSSTSEDGWISWVIIIIIIIAAVSGC